MKIRLCRDEDFAELARLRRQTIRNINAKDYPEDVIQKWSTKVGAQDLRKTADTRRRWVALDEDKIIGFCEYNFKGEISRIYVHKDYLRKGVGSRLLKAAEDSLEKQGYKTISIEAAITARNFYEANGYKVIKKILYKNNKNAPGYKMIKKLS